MTANATSFHLFLEGEWRGTYTPPFTTLYPSNILWYCCRCGEVFAKRIQVEPLAKPNFHYDYLICAQCRRSPEDYYAPWLDFRLSEEINRGWEPLDLIAEALYYNLRLYNHELTSSCNSSTPASAPASSILGAGAPGGGGSWSQDSLNGGLGHREDSRPGHLD